MKTCFWSLISSRRSYLNVSLQSQLAKRGSVSEGSHDVQVVTQGKKKHKKHRRKHKKDGSKKGNRPDKQVQEMTLVSSMRTPNIVQNVHIYIGHVLYKLKYGKSETGRYPSQCDASNPAL